MEAPENIYLFENPIDGTPDYRWLSKRSCSDDVEYTRTDAFIEKVVNFLEMLGYGFTITDNITKSQYDNIQLIEDFKEYIKGE